MKRKPDFENESLRMWVANDKEKKQYKQKENCIEYRGYIFGLNGFTIFKKKDKVVFAFKFKHESRMVMVYAGDESKDIKESYEILKKHAKSVGYAFSDVRETFDRILLEDKTIKHLVKKADRSGQLSKRRFNSNTNHIIKKP